MGRTQARALAALEEFELTGVCDLDGAAARTTGQDVQARAYNHFGAMLRLERPQVVAVCTSTDSHAELTIRAARAGVRGIYCEAPMATNLDDARAMLAACRKRDVTLVVNHQRRLGADLARARRLIESGAIGQVLLVRGNGGGDLLSDGTHMVDSILYMMGDPEVRWAFGQVHREINDYAREQAARQRVPTEPGFRYGHPVENGGIALLEVDGGARIELFWGDMHQEGRRYQDYEVFGTRGRLWRTDVLFAQNLFIQDAKGGPYEAGMEDGWCKPVPTRKGAPGSWRPVEVEWDQDQTDIERAYCLFAQAVRGGRPHPMSGEGAMRCLQVLIAIYESARTHRRVRLPVRQRAFPLELMIGPGDAGN